MRPQNRKVKELVELAAGTVRMAVAENERLIDTLERIAQDDAVGSSRTVDRVIGEVGAAFQIVAGHIEQVRVVRTHLERISSQT